ncbi:unnamed protein product [Dibothriocephalus latus]|uniref:ABC transmembrane type-1 domain-containing protein n=1 Tax=Dibothriocephalus latus TaxID=60516 RepID=A0A3P7LVU5_DIBLA|nr:unnamed protein product [Dibothriocephalus latus]
MKASGNCRTFMDAWDYYAAGHTGRVASEDLRNSGCALLRFLDKDSTHPNWYGYFLASGCFAASFISSLLFNQGFYLIFTAALSARSALMAAIYRKTLNLSPESRGAYTTGQIVNFLTVDVDRLLEVLSK